jgi:glycosyltransferase involved in cell wall biosynthesis
VGGNADLVLQGATGDIVPPSDLHAMAQKLIERISSLEQSRLMGQAGRQRVLDRFSMQAMISNYLAVYDQHLSRQHP